MLPEEPAPCADLPLQARTKARSNGCGKEASKAARQWKKALRDEVEREWAEMKRQHVTNVEAWAEECSRLLEGGTKNKDLPPKPKLGKKPQAPVVDDEEDEVEEEPRDDDEAYFSLYILMP
ncbi:hypothetical protein B0H11DRAFT_1941445 [Mycena galericulata]|nr:hypothetical protein B0H11DRAFT_1941445 [Mycena galericulata]